MMGLTHRIQQLKMNRFRKRNITLRFGIFLFTLFWFNTSVLGQTTITINPNDNDLTAVSSHIIGVCRNHAANDRPAVGNFDVKMASYEEISPRFGKKRKLYRLGGSPFDGNNNGGFSWSYPGYLWPTVDYADGGGLLPTNVPSPYDNLDRFVQEAIQIDADMIIPINVITGSTIEAIGILDFLIDNDLLDRVGLFEMGNELYGDWQIGHNMFACNAERYGNRASMFIHAMISHMQDNGYSKDILNFALMGSFNGSWGAQASTLRLVDNGSNNYEVQYRTSGSYYSDYRYNWELSNGEVLIDQNISVTLPPGVQPEKVTIYFGAPSITPVYEFVSWSESCETGNNNNHSPTAAWSNNPDQGIKKITDSYLSNENLIENGHPIFQYIAFHNYADGSKFYQGKDGDYNGTEEFYCNNVLQSPSVDDVYKHVMAVNSKFANEEFVAGVKKLKDVGVKLVNTEFGSIGIVGNHPMYGDGQEHDLSKTISEAMFTADQMLTGIKYGMSGATAFALFHTNDGGDNIFFPIGNNNNPYPSYYAQRIIAEHLGSFYMGSTTHSNMPQVNPFLCNDNETFDQIGYASTRDADGTIRIMVLNRGTTSVNVNFDVGGQSSNYTSEIISYHGDQVLSAPTSIDAPLVINNLSSVNILPYSINVLVLQPNNTCAGCANYTITGTETWTSSPSASIGKITVNSGAVLKINSNVALSFCSNGMLEILPGGKVDLRGTLTSCGQEWQGVRVRGDFNSSFVQQGEFYGLNGTIKNARIAIGAMTLYEWGALLGSGKVNCTGMEFINNATSFEMREFYGNASVKFYDCNFDVTNNQNFQNHIVLNRNHGVAFQICDFMNHQSAPNPTCRGILANQAPFTVDGMIWSVQYPGDVNIIKRSTFQNLAKGIEVNGNWQGAFRVRDAVFYKCAVGIHCTSTTGAVMLRNKFYMGDMHIDYKVEDSRQIGVAFEGMTNGFTFEENTFLNIYFGNTTNTTYGTTARGLLPFDVNVIKNNHYKNITYGNWAEENSGNVFEGLHYLCNSNTNPQVTGWNFTAIDPTNSIGMALRLNQGLQLTDLTYAPARNTFSHVLGGNGGVDDLRDFLSFTQNKYKYYYNPNVSDEVPLYHNIELHEGFEGNDCPSPYFLKEGYKKYRSLSPPERVSNEKDYLDHLLAYQKKKDEYVKVSKGTEQAHRIESELAYHLHELEHAAYKGYMAISRDSVINKDDLRLWMKRFNNMTGDYMLVEDLYTRKNFEGVWNVLNFMLQKYDMTEVEMKDYDNIVRIYESLIKADGEKLSSDDIQNLVEYAESEEGQVCYLARRILSQDYGYFFRPIIAELSGLRPSESNIELSDEPRVRMRVLPNPTDYYVEFNWEEFETVGREVRIEITNSIGGLIDILRPREGQYRQEWTTEKVSGNICYYRLLIDNQEVDGGQIIITK